MALARPLVFAGAVVTLLGTLAAAVTRAIREARFGDATTIVSTGEVYSQLLHSRDIQYAGYVAVALGLLLVAGGLALAIRASDRRSVEGD